MPSAGKARPEHSFVALGLRAPVIVTACGLKSPGVAPHNKATWQRTKRTSHQLNNALASEYCSSHTLWPLTYRRACPH
jgi:hypothetical protein